MGGIEEVIIKWLRGLFYKPEDSKIIIGGRFYDKVPRSKNSASPIDFDVRPQDDTDPKIIDILGCEELKPVLINDKYYWAHSEAEYIGNRTYKYTHHFEPINYLPEITPIIEKLNREYKVNKLRHQGMLLEPKIRR